MAPDLHAAVAHQASLYHASSSHCTSHCACCILMAGDGCCRSRDNIKGYIRQGRNTQQTAAQSHISHTHSTAHCCSLQKSHILASSVVYSPTQGSVMLFQRPFAHNSGRSNKYLLHFAEWKYKISVKKFLETDLHCVLF